MTTATLTPETSGMTAPDAPQTAVPGANGDANKQPSVNGVWYKTDLKGRRIGLKRITPVNMFRLTRFMGTDAGQASLGIAMSAASVVEIDGDAIPFPNTVRELEFLLQRLDWEGMAIVDEFVREVGELNEDQKVAAKNSPATRGSASGSRQ